MKLLGNKVNSTAHDYLEQRQGEKTVCPSVKSALHSNGEGFSRNCTHFVLHNELLPSLPLTSWLSYLTSLLAWFTNDPSSVN